MESGTQSFAELIETPTFVALREATIPIGTDLQRLHLYQEKGEGGRAVQYYLLANGYRIRPLDLETQHNCAKAEQWFDEILQLFVMARTRTHGPFD